MPNSPSAKKRLRQSFERRDRNRAVKSAVRSQIKKVRLAAAAGNVAVAETEFRLAAKRLDRAGAAGVIHRNAASRTKSRLSALIRRVKQAGTASA
jgi:small subunit ribosomal protein S20